MKRWWTQVSTNHPWWVVVTSVVMLLGLGWYALGLFDNLGSEDTFAALSTDAETAKTKLEETFGTSPSNEIILFERKDSSLGNAKSSVYQQAVTDTLAPLKDKVDSITTYATQPNEAFISRDGTKTYALIVGKGSSKEIYDTLETFQKTADQSKLHISLGGNAAAMQQTTRAVSKSLASVEKFTMPVLLILLLIFFRSGVAALVPLGMSGVTIVGAFAIARFLGNFVTIDSYAVNVITILGIGLSIDYALLSVNRFREELARGKTVAEAVGTIINTSGTTIFFSGVTVMACMLALLVFPMEFLHSVAIGSAAAIVMAVLFTVLILPAVLRLIGKHINSWHLPLPRHEQAQKKTGFWYRLAQATTNHPIVTLTATLVLIGLSLLPLSTFKINSGTDYRWLAQDSSAQTVAGVIEDDFSVSSPSITVMTMYPDTLDDTSRVARSCEVTRDLQKIEGVKQVISPTPLSETLSCDTIKQIYAYEQLPEAQKQYMAYAGIPAPSAQAFAQLEALKESHSRDKALKFDVVLTDTATSKLAYETLGRIRAYRPSNDAKLYVSGMTAQFHDTDEAYAKNIPWAAAVIGISMFVLLALHLRSFVLPLQAIFINTIAILISLSFLSGIFIHGWFSGLTHWPVVDGVIMTPLLLILSIAFGLAMDYSVFLYSRMYEVHRTTDDPKEAVRQGITKTGPIITAAALMMFVVVSAFATSSVLIMKMIGIGLSIAVLVDAFFIRLFLVPSIMALMGKTSWWAPKWLKKIDAKHD